MVTTENTGYIHNLKGFACECIANVKITVDLFPEVDDRDFEACSYQQLVLASTTDTDENKNDKTSHLFKMASTSDTIVMSLERNGVDVVPVLNDDTYGTYFALNSINYYSEQNVYAGYTIEWRKVLSAFGTGKYRLKVVTTSYGNTNTSYSVCYNLMNFSDSVADKTLRIESVMSGYMMRSAMNYKDINLVDMIRVEGFFGQSEEEFTITNDIFATSQGKNRVVEQRKVNNIDIYNFEIKPLLKCVADKIKNYHFFGNKIYMSDYNSTAYDYNLKRIQIYKDESFDFEYPVNSRKIAIKGKVKEQIQDQQKTNFY